jgi:hypothetical protein
VFLVVVADGVGFEGQHDAEGPADAEIPGGTLHPASVGVGVVFFEVAEVGGPVFVAAVVGRPGWWLVYGFVAAVAAGVHGEGWGLVGVEDVADELGAVGADGGGVGVVVFVKQVPVVHG